MTPHRVPLAEVSTIIQGGRHKLSGNDFVDPNDGYPAFGAGGLNGYLPTYEFDGQTAVVLSSIGARCGKCFLASGKWSSLANTQVILPDPTKADARFLWYQLNDESSWLRSGTAQPFIKPSTVKTRAVALPPLPEQHRIADILDKADAIRRKRKEAIALTEELLRSAFLEMFGDPLTNPKGWPVKPLLELCAAKQWPTIAASELSGSGYPVFGANGIIGYHSEMNHAKATVLITCRGATCGTINVCLPNSYVTGNSMALDDPDEQVITREYLEWVLRLRGLNDTITGSAQPQITRQSLQKVAFPVPPVESQRAFEKLLRGSGRLRGDLERPAAEAESLFNSLVARAFTGALGAAC